MHDYAHILEEAGGVAAPPPAFARLRSALAAELERGTRELAASRSGYDAPLIAGVTAGLAVLPVAAALRADPGAVPERAWLLTAAMVGALVAAGATEPLCAGAWEGRLALGGPGADPELTVLAFEEQAAGIDRLRTLALELPPGLTEAADLRAPLNPMFAVAERVARRGGRPADPDDVEELGDDGAGPARPHDDPDPALRAARRILQRLRGMGKWGGYHTEFTHLARGFPGHERALALAVGEALLEAGLLVEKPSVGQRHVFLDPGRAADVHALVDDGVPPSGLDLP